jgi:mRNA interferase MazF
MTPAGQAYPFRVACRFGGQEGQVVLDQLRTVDRGRLRRRLGVLPAPALDATLTVLREMFEA